MIWFTSDTHFGHRNIISYCDRPWTNVKEMNEGLIRGWNYRVKDSDTVYHLGDLSFVDQEWTHSILSRLNGEIILVKGNHDRNWTSDRISKTVLALYTELEGQQVYLTHKPASEWKGAEEGVWHLHGHLHGNPYHRDSPTPTHFLRQDVGADVWNWKPINMDDLRRKFGLA